MYLLLHEQFFWLAWLAIPFLFELIPALFTYILLDKNKKPKLDIPPKLFPEITILIPVYNCQETLEKCLLSINECSYDNDLITILLLDSGSTDQTFDIFQKCQLEFDIGMHWLSSNDTKAKALNKGIFNSEGKYIINVDSIGYFEKESLRNIVTRFENDRTVDCLTGVVLPFQEDIKKTKSFKKRIIKKFEYLEYCRTFFVGKNYQNTSNNLFSVSAPYTAFKKSSLLSTFLYDTNSIVEDSHLTAQLNVKNLKVRLSENAIFYIPSSNCIKDYILNRKRWQMDKLVIFQKKFFSNQRAMIRNCSKVFRLIKILWYAFLIYWTLQYYYLRVLGQVLFVIYQLYFLSNIFYAVNILGYFDDFKQEKKFYRKLVLYIFMHPVYKLIIYPYHFIHQKQIKETKNVKKNVSI